MPWFSILYLIVCAWIYVSRNVLSINYYNRFEFFFLIAFDRSHIGFFVLYVLLSFPYFCFVFFFLLDLFTWMWICLLWDFKFKLRIWYFI